MATLINGNGNLAIYAQQDADWYAALMGGQTVITAVGNQFAYELLASNTIGVKDGVIITSEGRRIQLDTNAIDSFDIPTGAQGTTNYYIIGYHLVTGNQSEQTCETFVQLMENGTDTIPEGSFRDGDDEVFVSLYRVEQDDLTIGTITLLLPQLSGSFQSQITELNNDLTNTVTSSQIGSGTKNFSISNTRKRLLCITKKSGVIVESKEIPVNVLENGDAILLGNKAPIVGTENIPSNAILSQNLVDEELFQKVYSNSIGGANYINGSLRGVNNGTEIQPNTGTSIGLATDLSTSEGASITYNGNNSFTITVTDSTLSVYVY